MAARFAGRPLQEKNKQERKASEVAPSRWWPGVPARRGRSGSPFARLHCGGWPLLSVSLLLIFLFGFLYLFLLTVFSKLQTFGSRFVLPRRKQRQRNNRRLHHHTHTGAHTHVHTRTHAQTLARSQNKDLVKTKTNQNKKHEITKTGKEDNS